MSQTRKTDPIEQERDLGLGGAKPQVGGHRQDRAGASAHAVDRRNERLRALPHRLHGLAGHAGKFEQMDRVHLDQRADDLEHVAAGTEIAAFAGEDEGLHLLVLCGSAENIGDLGVALEGERVLLVGPVQRERRDLAVDREPHMLRLVVCERQRDRVRHHGIAARSAPCGRRLWSSRAGSSAFRSPSIQDLRRSPRSSSHACAPSCGTRGGLPP